ncbi:serine hydrolase domain-containing protein [Endozoicomonas lisbonensis]|uniref:CubicO group peptidase (Beta-lactamase class C family) n=1 Tax=Endozoicomonas lisbonensis TaxID=3120522 RepID=A0ABV2SDX1_9GAMM
MKFDLPSLTLSTVAAALLLALSSSMVRANPVEKALEVTGAKVNQPVSSAKQPFSNEFVSEARDNLNNFHWQMGGDHSLYYNLRMSEFLPTAIASPNDEYQALSRDINPKLGELRQMTSLGELTLDEYMVHPQFRTQGLILIHKGKVVYESYPGMKSTDRHIWASSAKTTVGLIVAMLAEENKVDHSKSITHYVPQLKKTVWDDVTVLDALNHTTGLDNEETLESILDPDSAVVRFFGAGFGSPREATGEVESWLDVAKDQNKINGESAGKRFRYASLNTTVLTLMIENIEGKPWVDVFEERVWSKMMARQPALFNLTPDGTALPVGLMSSTLEDMARFGLLFTPSWETSAVEPVVSNEMLNRIYNSGNQASYKGSSKYESAPSMFNDQAKYQSYQFDFVFSDGAIAKSGNLGQMLYIDPVKDFVGVVFSTNPYHSGFGEFKAAAYMRAASQMLSTP